MRRPAVFGALAFAAALLAGVVLPGCGSKAPRGLVLVTIDTCRADRLSCYHGTASTPTLDALAGRGALFEQVTAPVPLTAPSHCTVMTGLYPDRHTVRDNGAARLPQSAETIAEILRDAGWRTAAFVSAFPLARKFGVDQGFDTFDDEFARPAAGGSGDEQSGDVARRLFYDERTAEETVDRALPWLREAARGGEPFFVWIHFFDPHASYRPPARFLRAPGADPYDGEISYVDEQIGRVLGELAGLSDRLTVAVTADHGESLGEHEEGTHGLFVYESTLRVPWIVAGPGVPAGSRVPAPVSLVDVTPTLLDLLSLDAPNGLDGESRVYLLDDGGADGADAAATVVHGECLYPWIHYDWAPLRTVRRGRWKLIDAPTPELYDLAADPGETTNVVAEHPDVARDLREEIALHAGRGGELPPEDLHVDEATIERLERLGYVGSRGGDTPADAAIPWGGGHRDPKEMVGFFNRLQEIPTLMLQGRYDDARRALDELRALDPGNANVLVKMALLYRVQEEWEEAAHWCREILKLDPDDHDTRRNLATALERTGDVAGAIDAYREIVSRDPARVEAWKGLGVICAENDRHEEARLAFEEAVARAPDDAAAHASFGAALERAGFPAEAVARFDRALELDPTLPAAVNGKALVFSHTGRPREAARLLRAALPALEDDVDTRNNLAWILANDRIDPAEAWTHAQRARELSPDDPAVLDTFGWAAILSGHAAEAVEPLEKAWQLTRDAEVRAHLGIALAESGRATEGKAHVRAAVAERPALADVPEVARWNRR
ncbi:sulfatase-like hydrolase/transferase [bacterium]|nr:sulfatase-like hydrolase/transferase [bacterium]